MPSTLSIKSRTGKWEIILAHTYIYMPQQQFSANILRNHMLRFLLRENSKQLTRPLERINRV